MIDPSQIAAIVAGLAAIATSYVALGSRHDRQIARRTAMLMKSGSALPRQAMLAAPFVRRALGPAVGRLAALAHALTPARARAKFEALLAGAGIYDPQKRQALLASQALAWVGAIVLGGMVALWRPACGILAALAFIAAGALAPRCYLVRSARLRRETITRELPDGLDLLTANVEAGLGFDAAVLRIAQRPVRRPSPLQQELSLYVSDVRLGRARHEALRALAERTGVEDLRTVVASLIQSDQLGVGVSTVLRAQSQHVRTRRRHRAQTEAFQAPIKLLFPLVFFIFPAMFVVTLGPAALRIIDTFTAMRH
ncbi:MAG: type II secretion system F family protein [Cyanobacteria bacterium REEB65]|nr:type II secretion system F family protein [Cyanobacteria bacterium REEB65]